MPPAKPGRPISSRAPRATGIRLAVGLPFVFLAFSVSMTLVTVDVLLWRLGVWDPASLSAKEERIVRSTKLWAMALGGATALTLGGLLALGISRPVRRMVSQLEGSLPPDSAEIPAPRDVNEIRQLANTLNHVLLSFDKYVRTADIVRQLPDAVLTIGPDGEIRSANPEAVRLLGLAPDAAAWPTLAEALGTGADTERLLGAVRRTGGGHGPEVLRSVVLIRRDGEPVEVESTALRAAGDRGRDVVLTLKDLTRVQAIRGEMRRVDQLAAVGGAIATMVHEIAGPLQSIGTLTDLLLADAPPGSPPRLYLEKLRASVDQMHRVTDEIRTLTQVDLREPVPCEVHTLTSEAVWLVEARFRDKAVKVTREIPAALPSLPGDPQRLSRALENLITNAFEAVPAGGQVRVAAALEQTAGGRAIVVRVWNAGSYIPESERARIFTLFYTTKNRGSGLGLPIAYRSVVDHGGRIELQSSPEGGTEFAVVLPLPPAAR